MPNPSNPKPYSPWVTSFFAQGKRLVAVSLCAGALSMSCPAHATGRILRSFASLDKVLRDTAGKFPQDGSAVALAQDFRTLVQSGSSRNVILLMALRIRTADPDFVRWRSIAQAVSTDTTPRGLAIEAWVAAMDETLNSVSSEGLALAAQALTEVINLPEAEDDNRFLSVARRRKTAHDQTPPLADLFLTLDQIVARRLILQPPGATERSGSTSPAPPPSPPHASGDSAATGRSSRPTTGSAQRTGAVTPAHHDKSTIKTEPSQGDRAPRKPGSTGERDRPAAAPALGIKPAVP